jgi:ectoine hydroxylase-related dioxygenase (phytanoyl-CoA dioxygenase family)
VTQSRCDEVHGEGPGFTRLDGFVEAAVGLAMQQDVIGLVRAAADGGIVEGAFVMPEAQPDFVGREPEDRISKVFRLHRRPPFADFLRTPEVVAVLVDLLGDDVDCFLSQFIFKNPGAWGQPWHQDSYYFHFDPPRPIVGLWLAVSEATRENGCLHVVPASHREPIHRHVADRRPGANYGYVEIVDHDMAEALPVLMQPGDLLVFDGHLMHCSTDNESGAPRAAMVFHFCPASTREDGPPSPVNDRVPLLRGGSPCPNQPF